MPEQSATPGCMRRCFAFLVLVGVATAACSSATDGSGENNTGIAGGNAGKNAGGNAGDAGASVTATGGGSAGSGGASGGAAGVASGGIGGQTSAPKEFAGPLGRRCSDGTACEGNLDCFAATGTTFSDEGPAGGFCSKRCNIDADCKSLTDPNINDAPRCVALVPSIADSTVCMPGCRLADKTACGGRPDVACWSLSDSPSDGTGRVCIPLCNNDDECPSGRVCDGATNLCSPWATGGGIALGGTCDPNVTNDCANGFCYAFTGGAVCTSYCRRSTFPQCGGNGENATCGWVFAGDEKAGPVDTGMCADTCACNRDCAAGTYCANHVDRASMAKPGICTIGSGPGIESCP